MQTFYSHATTDDQNKKTGSKTIQKHTYGVLDKALERLSEKVSFSYDIESLKKFITDICLLHDLGKYTDYFQDYLLTNNFDQRLKSHARFGANVIYHLYGDNPYLAYLGYYLVLNHHRNLHWPFNADRMLLGKNDIKLLKEEFEKKRTTLVPNISQIEQELKINLEGYLKFPDRKPFTRYLEDWTENKMKIENYFFICYLFSLLIEGDKIDASDSSLHQFNSILKDSVDRFLGPPPSNISIQNMLRNRVRHKVCSHLLEKDIVNYRLFTLAAPTGIGKTFTALSFALGLRDKLPHQPQIITALPFINIIEQTLSEYEKVLAGQDVIIKGHFQFADIVKEDKEKGEKDSEKNYSQKRMELKTWQADIIVTSFVQLLQTMIAHKNKWLLKFNHFAGSIIIMDEVQNIKLEQVPLIGATIYFMSEFLNTRFILMTATKPLIFELADQVILSERGISITNKIKNLLPEATEIYQQFHRTKIVPLLTDEIMTTEIFVEIVKKRIHGQSCLIVCNKVARSIEVFKALQEQQVDLGLKEDDFYYLSTNILPVERLEIINQIKKDIADRKNPILVATQVVEAGVDLDFKLGFRDLGPIDSIVQVAGRINRNDKGDKYAPLYIVDFGECKDIYGSITAIQAKSTLEDTEILEPAYFTLVEKYFNDVSGKKNYQVSKKLFKGMEGLYFDGEETDDILPIKNFRVINGQEYAVTVFIELNEKARISKAAFLNQYTYKNRKEKYQFKDDFEKTYKKAFFQHTITVPNFYTEDLPLIDETKPDMLIKYVSQENIKNYYFDKTGFKREKKTETNKDHTLQY